MNSRRKRTEQVSVDFVYRSHTRASRNCFKVDEQRGSQMQSVKEVERKPSHQKRLLFQHVVWQEKL